MIWHFKAYIVKSEIYYKDDDQEEIILVPKELSTDQHNSNNMSQPTEGSEPST